MILKVNLLDLSEQYKEIRKEALKEIEKVCDSGRFVLGENVNKLEKEIAKYTGSKYAVGVASGTDALVVSLMALGIKAGDKVLTSPFTFYATAGAISTIGAVPVFCDIDESTYNIDVQEAEKVLKSTKGKNIKAIIPVHLYGQSADMTEIKKLARKYKLKVIEDCAQSIGAKYKGKGVGSIGDTGCFSFYPSKNLGCFGDGGMVTTNSKSIFDKLMMVRVHGSSKRYLHDMIGVNSRLDELQAAVLRVKLKRLPTWEKGRSKVAKNYAKLFKKYDLADKVTLPFISKDCDSVYNQFIIRVKKRDNLKKFLSDNNIYTDIYYPIPLHLQKCYKDLKYKKGSFPKSELAAKETLAIPMYAELKLNEQEYVVQKIKEFYN